MYNPAHFCVNDQAAIFDLIDRFPLATLVTFRGGEFDANQIPLLRTEGVNNEICLIGHVSRNNSLWSESERNERVLVVFKGADGYISPNWYPGKKETQNYVPTWNYQVVNLRGRLEVLDNQKYVRGVVARLVKKFESRQNKPWKMTESEPDYIKEKLAAIVGIRIVVTEIEAKSKLSQNMENRDREGAILGVCKGGNVGLYEAMKNQKLD